MRPSAKTLAVNAAVVTALVGGGVAYITLDNAVVLTVDGQTETVHSFSSNVEDVLDDRGIELTARDEVIPSLESPVKDGTEISVRYAREITVTLDGAEQQVWTTALSVDEALADLDIRHQDADISVARSQTIGRDGLNFEVRTPKAITVVADGASKPFTTTALTVREALTEAGVSLGDLDQVKPTLESPLAEDVTVTVARIAVKSRTETVPVAFTTTEQKDSSLEKGKKSTVTAGKNGSLQRVLQQTFVDGTLHNEKIVSETVVVAAVSAVVKVGTKEPPRSDDSGGSDSGNNVPAGVWDKLAKCESGGNWSINTGNGYYGGLQFSAGTWRAFGGSGLPHQNSKAEQIRIATKVRDNRGGYGDWPGCARKLGLPLG